MRLTSNRVVPDSGLSRRATVDLKIFPLGRTESNTAVLAIEISVESIGFEGRRPVVCFSDVPVCELPRRRVFRPHLSRWDFEPYGIAIERERLEALTARPVIYGPADCWETLAEQERPFFQLSQSSSKKIDWESENEWRIMGDVRLETIAHDQAFVFVRTQTEAEIIADLSPWPIVVLLPEE